MRIPPRTKPTIRFENAKQEDVSDISTCLAAAYADAMQTIPDLPDVTGGIADEIVNNRVILARGGDTLAGVVIYATQGLNAKIVNLAVSPEFRRLGIAAKLLAVVEDDARAQGCVSMELRTHRLMTETRTFYARLGWRETDPMGNSVALRKEV